MTSRAGAPAAATKRRRKNPSQPGDSSRSREASEESNAETTEAAGDDTDTGSITAPLSARTRAGLQDTGLPSPNVDAITQNVFAHPGSNAPAGSNVGGRVPMVVDSETTDGNESTASKYDGDVSSAPVSSRRNHHPHTSSHAHTHSDASMASFTGTQQPAEHAGQGSSSSTQHSRAYYDGLAARSPRLQNMPSSSSIVSVDSQSGDSRENTMLGGIPESPAPQIPHAPPPHSRHISPGSASATTTTTSPPPSRPMRPAHQDSLSSLNSEAVHHPAPHGFLAKMSALDLQESVRLAIDGAGADGVDRNYRINPPPQGRPVRIYADGVYDLFHYGHALALRQAKLAFPSVRLIVGVCSDELVRRHKATPVMSSAERYESVRNCRWVDEVVEDAPWIIDQAFLDEHEIDYVAHDEAPYEGTTPGQSDIYRFVKDLGKFLPTRRTDGVSTSELLQRIVEGYRDGAYDKKLLKIGHPELCSNPPSEKGSSRSRGGD